MLKFEFSFIVIKDVHIWCCLPSLNHCLHSLLLFSHAPPFSPLLFILFLSCPLTADTLVVSGYQQKGQLLLVTTDSGSDVTSLSVGQWEVFDFPPTAISGRHSVIHHLEICSLRVTGSPERNIGYMFKRAVAYYCLRGYELNRLALVL